MPEVKLPHHYLGGDISGAEDWDSAGPGRPSDPPGATGLHAADITQSTFTDAGWDFDTVWTMPTCTGWPVLQWQDPPATPDCSATDDLPTALAHLLTVLLDILNQLLALFHWLLPTPTT